MMCLNNSKNYKFVDNENLLKNKLKLFIKTSKIDCTSILQTDKLFSIQNKLKCALEQILNFKKSIIQTILWVVMGCCLRFFSKRSRGMLTLQKYQVLKQMQLGVGGYAEIWKCKDIHNNKIYALKQILLQNKQMQQMFERQTKIMKKVQEGRNVIKIYASQWIKRQQYQVGCILMQFGQGTLFDKLKNQRISAREIVNILKQICNGVKQMHTAGYYHLDIKPQNIIVCTSGYAQPMYKLADFGSSIENQIFIDNLTRQQKNSYIEYFQANSTLIYRAPQMIDLHMKNNVIGQKSDVWMIGCLAYLLLYRKHPFQQGTKLGIMSCNVIYRRNQFNLDAGDKIIENQLISIFQKIFVRKTSERINLDELIEQLDRIEQNYVH